MKLLICDFNRTLYDPVSQQLFAGANETLAHSQELGVVIVLLSTEHLSRKEQIKSLGIMQYFTTVEFVAEKTGAIVTAILKEYGCEPKDALIIGDDPIGELAIGKQLRIPTVAVGTGFCDERTAREMGIPFYPSFKEIKDIQV